MSDLQETLARLRTFNKEAFQPTPAPAPPMDPAMAQQGGPPPMDPAMAQQGGPPPMDPAMAQQGGPPPGGLPPELEQVISELAGGMEQMSGVIARLQEDNASQAQERKAFAAELEKLKMAILSPAPMQGGPGGTPSMM